MVGPLARHASEMKENKSEDSVSRVATGRGKSYKHGLKVSQHES